MYPERERSYTRSERARELAAIGSAMEKLDGDDSCGTDDLATIGERCVSNVPIIPPICCAFITRPEGGPVHQAFPLNVFQKKKSKK